MTKVLKVRDISRGATSNTATAFSNVDGCIIEVANNGKYLKSTYKVEPVPVCKANYRIHQFKQNVCSILNELNLNDSIIVGKMSAGINSTELECWKITLVSTAKVEKKGSDKRFERKEVKPSELPESAVLSMVTDNKTGVTKVSGQWEV